MAEDELIKVNIVRPDEDDQDEEYVPDQTRVNVVRGGSERGYSHTQVRSSYDSRGEESYINLYERSTDEELVGINFSENNLQIMQHGIKNRGWQGIRDIVGPTADVVNCISLNRDEARVVGEDLLYFADNGRLPGPK